MYIYIHRNHIILECGVQQYIQCVYLHMYIIYIWVQWSMPTKCNFYVIHTSYHPSFWRSQSDWLFRARSARSLLIQALQAFVGGFPYGLTTSKWPFDVGKMMKIITCQMEWDNICSDKPSVVVKKNEKHVDVIWYSKLLMVLTMDDRLFKQHGKIQQQIRGFKQKFCSNPEGSLGMNCNYKAWWLIDVSLTGLNQLYSINNWNRKHCIE